MGTRAHVPGVWRTNFHTPRAITHLGAAATCVQLCEDTRSEDSRKELDDADADEKRQLRLAGRPPPTFASAPCGPSHGAIADGLEDGLNPLA